MRNPSKWSRDSCLLTLKWLPTYQANKLSIYAHEPRRHFPKRRQRNDIDANSLTNRIKLATLWFGQWWGQTEAFFSQGFLLIREIPSFHVFICRLDLVFILALLAFSFSPFRLKHFIKWFQLESADWQWPTPRSLQCHQFSSFQPKWNQTAAQNETNCICLFILAVSLVAFASPRLGRFSTRFQSSNFENGAQFQSILLPPPSFLPPPFSP